MKASRSPRPGGRPAASGAPDADIGAKGGERGKGAAVPLRLAACELCAEDVALRYRVQHREDRVWRLVCPACQARVSADNPYYRYGGTWKAKRRRA